MKPLQIDVVFFMFISSLFTFRENSNNLVFNGIRTIAPDEDWPRLRLGFGLGLVLGLETNFPRGELS